MKYDPVKHHRHSTRLKDYDYAQSGAYFVTVVTQHRKCLFGDIIDDKAHLNDAGRLVQSVWTELAAYYPAVLPDAFVVMPNHFHGIIVLVTPTEGASSGQARGPAPTMSVSDVVHRFKTLTTKRYTDGVKEFGWTPFSRRLWQRNYYEHIIRDEKSLDHIRQYIADNPAHWTCDRENPAATMLEPKDAWRT